MRARASSGQPADTNDFRRRHRVLAHPPTSPEIHRVLGGIVEAPGTLSRNRRTGNRVSASKIFTDVLEGSGTVPLPTAKPPARASGRLIEKRRRRPPTNRLPLNSLHQARHGIAARTDAWRYPAPQLPFPSVLRWAVVRHPPPARATDASRSARLPAATRRRAAPRR